jgi:hypothetical protein
MLARLQCVLLFAGLHAMSNNQEKGKSWLSIGGSLALSCGAPCPKWKSKAL